MPSQTEIDVSIHTTRLHGVKFVNYDEGLNQLKWWQKMQDPVLNHLLALALQNNNQLEMAKANILQAQASLQAARFAWIPSLDAGGAGFIGSGFDTQFKPQGVFSASPALVKLGNMRFNGYAVGFVPKYSLNIMQNLSNERYATAANAERVAAYSALRLSIISQVSGSYFMLLGQKAQYKIQSSQLKHLKILKQLETKRYNVGLSDLTPVTQLEKQIQASQANLSALQTSMVQVENALQVLINREPGPLATKTTITQLSTRGIIPSSVPSSVLKSRPDILIASENLNMANANIGIEKANFFPSLSLTDLLGRASLELSQFFKVGTGLWLGDAAASMSLLNASNFAKIKAARASYMATYYNYVQTVKSALADVDDSLTRYESGRQIYKDQSTALAATNRLYNLTTTRYKSGAIDQRSLLNAQLEVDLAQLNVNQAKMQLLDSIVEVYQSLGIK